MAAMGTAALFALAIVSAPFVLALLWWGMRLARRLSAETKNVGGARRTFVLAWTAFLPLSMAIVLVAGWLAFTLLDDERDCHTLGLSHVTMCLVPTGLNTPEAVYFRDAPNVQMSNARLKTVGRSRGAIYAQATNDVYFFWDVAARTVEVLPDRPSLDRVAATHGITHVELVTATDFFAAAEHKWLPWLIVFGDLLLLIANRSVWRAQCRWLRAQRVA